MKMTKDKPVIEGLRFVISPNAYAAVFLNSDGVAAGNAMRMARQRLKQFSVQTKNHVTSDHLQYIQTDIQCL